MENLNSQIAIQHKAIQHLIEIVYGSDLKSFLIDLAEIVESNDERLVEGLWECASILPMMDHSGPNKIQGC